MSAGFGVASFGSTFFGGGGSSVVDPFTDLAVTGAPNLAVDVQPTVGTGLFRLGSSALGGPEVLALTETDAWMNVICDVTAVKLRRGATRLQGPLTRAEAGTCTVELLDYERRFDPLVNSDAIHAGTPFRLRAWGYADAPVYTEVRRNLVPNPRATVVGGWNGHSAGGAATESYVSVVGPGSNGIATAYRRTWTSAATGYLGGCLAGVHWTTVNPYVIHVTAGEPIAGGIYARPSKQQRLRGQIQFYDAAGVALGTAFSSGSALVDANTWQRFTMTGTVPAGAVRAVIWAFNVSGTGSSLWDVGDWLEVTGAQLRHHTTAETYFDGDTPDSGGSYYQWTGTPHASQSVQTVAVIESQAWESVLFTGELDDIPIAYAKTGAPTVTLSAVDVIGDLASWSSVGRPDPGIGGGQQLHQRIGWLIDEMGFPPEVLTANVDSYTATLAASNFAGGWDDIVAAQEAELGKVWANAANRLEVRGRGSYIHGPVRGTLSDVHEDADADPHCCYDDVAATLSTDQLINRVIAARRVPRETPPAPIAVGAITWEQRDMLIFYGWRGRAGDEAEILYPPELVTESAVVQADDTTSQAMYRVRALERRNLELQSDGQLAAWADAVISGASSPALRVDTVSPAPWNASPEAWMATCQTDIDDRWVFHYSPELGEPVYRTLGIVGIEHDIKPGGWSITWTTTTAPDD